MVCLLLPVHGLALNPANALSTYNYQTVWFYLLCGALAAAVLLAGLRWRCRLLQRQTHLLEQTRLLLETEMQKRVAELQAENAERKRTEAELANSLSVLHATLESTIDGILVVDTQGKLTNFNHQFAEMWRIPREILDTRDDEQAIRVAISLLKDPETFLSKVRSLYAQPEADSFDVLEMKDGRTIERYSQPQRVGRKVVGRMWCFRDITTRKIAEAKLAETSGLLDLLLENIPDLIYFKDVQSRFVRCSKSFLPRTKLTDFSELLGKTDADIYGTEYAQDALADEQEIIRTGQPIIGKTEKKSYRDGRVTWLLTTKIPWRDGSGAIIGIIGLSNDVTALKEYETNLAYQRDQLCALLESVPDDIYFKDLQSRFVLISASKAKGSLVQATLLRERRAACGLPADVPETELLYGLSDFDTYQSDDARIAYEDEMKIIRTGEAMVSKTEKQILSTGKECWWLTSKMPWRHRDGAIIGTLGISKDITELKESEIKIEQMHRQLLETSRQAGMAEVATGVLHNVGNVLNSVNVSATLVANQISQTKAVNIAKLSALINQHKTDLADFLTKDPRGQMVPGYLGTLADTIAEEHKTVMLELENLRKNIEHIKEIVAMQQSYARVSGVIETISVPDLVEDALRINAGSLARHDVDAIRDYQARPVITTDKHKVMQILINLVRNAKYACDESGRTNKQITVRTSSDDHGVQIAIIDNGVGIPAENLTRIFNHGFTTRKAGHGFGLHSGALAAKELGGALSVHSDGPDCGAMFTLELPYKPIPDSPAHE